MTYKTIIAHCNDVRRIDALMAAATALAERFQARIIGLSVVPPVLVLPAGMPGTPDTVVVDTQCQAYRQESPALKTAFETAARARKLAHEWREIEAGSDNVAIVAMQHVRHADLIVAAQTDPDWVQTAHLDIADRLAVESGRPVLIVPNGVARGEAGQNVLVAWNGKREAARAAFDALPILQQAKSVRIVSVSQQGNGVQQELSAQDMRASLLQHGISCERIATIQPHGGVGASLLQCAADQGCDLLVMGCYGHSRLREFILGGASRHVLGHMGIPVLMSH
jgi:nucleotide-binding universal stress UspA family protein